MRSEKIDRILTGKYTAIPCFIGIMVLVFYLTFNVIGAWLQEILEIGIDQLSAVVNQALTAANVNSAIHSLVIDGIFTGVGSVLSFLAGDRDLVFLPFTYGRQRLYCQSCICDGQAAAKDRPFRTEHCTDADRIWMYGSGGDGDQNPDQ